VKRRSRALRVLLLAPGLAAGLALSACTTVEVWERGRLAKPQMAVEPHPSQRLLREHVYLAREAAAGSEAGRGGGCGCY